jgi:hypothetical protein
MRFNNAAKVGIFKEPTALRALFYKPKFYFAKGTKEKFILKIT